MQANKEMNADKRMFSNVTSYLTEYNKIKHILESGSVLPPGTLTKLKAKKSDYENMITDAFKPPLVRNIADIINRK